MIHLFLLTLAGNTARSKTTVTKLLQAPLQRLHAPAPVGDATYTEDPPPILYVR